MTTPLDGDQDRTPTTGDALADEVLRAVAAGHAPGSLAERLAAAAPLEALAAVGVLGRSRQAAVAPVLVARAEGVGGSKELRKEARRGIHRLRALGLDVAVPLTSSQPQVLTGRQVELAEAWACAPDGVGSRALWLAAERPFGGIYAVAMVLNDVVGMKACSVEETTRKRFNQRFVSWREESGLSWVELPTDYARQLIGEALELNRESGVTIPTGFQQYERAIGSPARPFERAIIYEEISAAEVTLNPELLEQSPALLDEDELKGWFFGFDEVRSYALDLLQARQSQIVLSEELKAEREQRIIGSAIRDLVTPPMQRSLRRRLEEIAYLFLKTDRQAQARLAVAAAQRLAEGAVSLHPLLAAMMAKSLEIAAEVETAKVPVDLVRRSPYDPVR